MFNNFYIFVCLEKYYKKYYTTKIIYQIIIGYVVFLRSCENNYIPLVKKMLKSILCELYIINKNGRAIPI